MGLNRPSTVCTCFCLHDLWSTLWTVSKLIVFFFLLESDVRKKCAKGSQSSPRGHPVVMQPLYSRLRSQLHRRPIMILEKNIHWAVSLPQRTGSPLGDGLACFCGETTVCASQLRGSSRAEQRVAKLAALPWLRPSHA